jgi:aminoglycoside phosphotransferase (APT) family kinase protein
LTVPMRMPEAEIDVTADLVDRLIREQHPDLTGPLQLVANGWDNVIFRLGATRSVRLPRRQLAAELITNEQRWLPLLAPRVGVRIPLPERIGRPTVDYPWFWSIGPWFAGRPLTEVPIPDRTEYATDVADFLAQLHQPAPADAPHNPVRGIPLPGRTDLVSQQLASGVVDDPERVRTLWDGLVGTPAWTAAPVWVHGDPHPANVLISDHRMAAVIDFGDLTAGDPATDLAVGWLAFDQAGRELFRDRYASLGRLDPDTWGRARGWALSLGLSLLANSDDHPVLAAVGRHALCQARLDG